MYRTLTDPSEIIRLLRGRSPVAFDFETAPDEPWRNEAKAALDPHKAHIVGVSFATDRENVFYVPLVHRVGRNAARQDQLWQFWKEELFESPDVCVIAHNLSFESKFLYAKGILVQPPCYDTMAASRLTMKAPFTFRDLRDSGLKTLAAGLFGANLPSFEEVTSGRFFDEMDPSLPETVRYACADSDFTLRLYEKFNSWFAKNLPKHRYIAEALESPAAVYVGMMSCNGVPVDLAAMESAKRTAEEKICGLSQKLSDFTGGVNVGSSCSNAAFKTYLYQTLALPVLKKTEKQQPSLDDETMIRLKEYCSIERPGLVPLFDLVSEYRKWQKLRSTYIDGYLNFIDPATGRIHPELLPLAAETGRFACRRPNLQNQVAPGADPVGVRNFIAAPEGWLLLEADYSQAEIRLCAYLSRDEVLLQAYRNRVDVHAITTSAVFGITPAQAADRTDPNYKHRRTVAKSTMFGIMYGIGAAGLSKNLYVNAGVRHSREECENYIRSILNKYKGMAHWQAVQKKSAFYSMYVETALGRRRWLPEIRSKSGFERSAAERMAINTPVQGLGADCLKHAMALLVKELRGREDIRPILTVHDSLVFLVREESLAEAESIVKRCMETPPPLPDFMPLVADVSSGKRYGELE